MSFTGLATTPNETLKSSGLELTSLPLDRNKKSNLPTRAASKIAISSRANVSAMQLRGPRLNGMNEHCILAPPFLSDNQRPMSQVDGLGHAVWDALENPTDDSPPRQYTGDLWIAQGDIASIVPSGTT